MKEDRVTLLCLGEAAYNIGVELKNFGLYDLLYIGDNELEADENVLLPKYENNKNNDLFAHEQYDALDVTQYDISSKVSDEIIMITCGASDVSGAALNILAELKDKSINILYVKPDIDFIPEIKAMQHRVTFGVLQQYARSGLVDGIYIVDNIELEKIIGEVSINEYYSKINSTIAQVFGSYIFCLKRRPAFGKPIGSSFGTTRIHTVGFADDEMNEVLFYDLKNVSEKGNIFPLEIKFYFVIGQKKLDEDKTLMLKIKTGMKQKKEKFGDIKYEIHSGEDQEEYAVVIISTSFVQEDL